MTDLFGGEIKENPKETSKMTEEYKQKKTEIASAYFKAMRLGLLEDALYWMLVMYENGDRFHIAYLLIEMAVEDVVDPTVLPFCMAVFDCVGKLKESSNHLVRATILVTKAKKWYQEEEGRQEVELWQKVEEEVKKQPMRKLPKYCLDSFTKTGQKALKEKDWAHYCGEFSGSWRGWNNIAKLYKEGKLQEKIKQLSEGMF